MSKVKPFYKQTTFYLSVVALILSLASLILYAVNGPSEYNGGVVSGAVVAADIVAVICISVAIGSRVAEDYLADKKVLMDIFSYKRFLMYVAFISLLYSFIMSILAEYSLIGTILYPIVSGTVGDPVDPVLSFSYFAKLIGTLIAFILTLTISKIQKSSFYKSEKVNNQPLTESKVAGE